MYEHEYEGLTEPLADLYSVSDGMLENSDVIFHSNVWWFIEENEQLIDS